MLAGDQLGQIPFLLLGTAIAPDLIDAKIGMSTVGQPDSSRSARDFFHGDAMGEIAETRAAPLLFHRDAEKAKRAELRPQVAGKFIGPVDVVGPRRNLCLRKGAHRLAQHVDVAAERIIQSRQSVTDHHTLHPWPDPGLPRSLASGPSG